MSAPGTLQANFIARPYRSVSVQHTDTELDEDVVTRLVASRPVYRRTEFVVLAHDEDRTLVQVERAPPPEDGSDPLFLPVTAVHYLAGPDDVAFIRDDDVDTGNATQMARCALASGRRARVFVIEGRFQHVNFIVSPAPLSIRLIEVTPPEPPKLLEMARKVIDYDEDLPPIELLFSPIDLLTLARQAHGGPVLFPCRSSGLDLNAPVHFLDEGPPEEPDWTLIGCERSRQIHAFFYGHDPAHRVDLCPKVVDDLTDRPTLAKCCLIERGIERSGARRVVPWGATLEEVRQALRELVAL